MILQSIILEEMSWKLYFKALSLKKWVEKCAFLWKNETHHIACGCVWKSLRSGGIKCITMARFLWPTQICFTNASTSWTLAGVQHHRITAKGKPHLYKLISKLQKGWHKRLLLIGLNVVFFAQLHKKTLFSCHVGVKSCHIQNNTQNSDSPRFVRTKTLVLSHIYRVATASARDCWNRVWRTLKIFVDEGD